LQPSRRPLFERRHRKRPYLHPSRGAGRRAGHDRPSDRGRHATGGRRDATARPSRRGVAELFLHRLERDPYPPASSCAADAAPARCLGARRVPYRLLWPRLSRSRLMSMCAETLAPRESGHRPVAASRASRSSTDVLRVEVIRSGPKALELGSPPDGRARGAAVASELRIRCSRRRSTR
jgi:hypothetical protein